MAALTLFELIERYADNHEVGISQGAKDQLRWSVGAWAKWAGHPLTVEHLQRETLNGYLDWMREHRAEDTVRTRRGNLLTLWKHAYEEGLVDEAPRKIRRLKRRKKIPTAWTREEIEQLLAAAGAVRGTFVRSGVERAAYWQSLIMAAWDTALRLGDLLQLERSQIAQDGSLVIRQSKTGDDVLVILLPQTIAQIDRCCASPPRRLIWPPFGRRDQFYVQFGRLVRDAGIREGTFKWLRRASITAVEAQQDGAGTRHAGHRTRAVTLQSYIDPRQLEQDRPQPPPLRLKQ